MSFWQFVHAIVPLSVLATFFCLYMWKKWLDERTSFLNAAFASGIISYAFTPFIQDLNFQAYNDLGFWLYCTLVVTNLVLWVLGVALAFYIQGQVEGFYYRRRSRRTFADFNLV